MKISFAEQLKNGRGEYIYLVRGKASDNGKSVWHYVLVDKLKKPMYERAVTTDSIDLDDYGEILYSGFGENPPDDIDALIKDKYC